MDTLKDFLISNFNTPDSKTFIYINPWDINTFQVITSDLFGTNFKLPKYFLLYTLEEIYSKKINLIDFVKNSDSIIDTNGKTIHIDSNFISNKLGNKYFYNIVLKRYYEYLDVHKEEFIDLFIEELNSIIMNSYMIIDTNSMKLDTKIYTTSKNYNSPLESVLEEIQWKNSLSLESNYMAIPTLLAKNFIDV